MANASSAARKMDEQADDQTQAEVARLKLAVAGLTDVGCVRDNNEDTYGFFEAEDRSHGVLMLVADGMGGAAGGEVASRLAVETIHGSFSELVDIAGDARAALLLAFERANQVIFNRASNDSKLGGMGTTCTAALISDLKLSVAHVGDSRAYLISNGELRQVTHDHSLAAEIERRARPGTKVPPSGHHVLTRCLGVSDSVEVDLNDEPHELQPDDTLVLCSDGLSNVVTEDEIRDCVSGGDPEEACKRLVALARERGGPDNITLQVGVIQRA